MTANVEVARHAEVPGAVIRRGPGGPLPPRLAKVAAAQISRIPDGPPQPRPASRQRAAILIVAMLTVKAELAPVAVFAIVLAAIRGLVRDSQVIPHALSWYLGPAPAWYIRRQNRRHLRQQMLDAPTG